MIPVMIYYNMRLLTLVMRIYSSWLPYPQSVFRVLPDHPPVHTHYICSIIELTSPGVLWFNTHSYD